MKKSMLLSLAAAAALLLPAAALADGHSEIVIAATHAGLAAQGSDVATVHMHLHHTLNCLVGPNGAGFDAKEMDPCAHAGSGAIPDATKTATKTALQAAATEASAGIAETDLAKAKAAAAQTADMLKKAE
ncbi:MAG: hypothetical protein KGI68_03310 [Alphaproteobacteria bacterium]|nr:hypothetical protein [Alphaproteobacteria bacterium]MDE1985023.1 hypothetical protein [Alphaproteobacteria bacterium]MDE2162364.1 hypothetical protein [Alphaproteobacteria bacterium]